MSIDQDKTSGITTVAIEWPDSATASRWANGYVALANELIRARALRESGRNISYLNAQLSRTSSIELQQGLYDLIESETKTQMLARTGVSNMRLPCWIQPLPRNFDPGRAAHS